MAFEGLKKELLRAVRGRRTQGQVSKRLGSKFNKVYRWEAARTKMSWEEFAGLCEACGTGLRPALRKAFGYQGSPGRADALLAKLAGQASSQEAAREWVFSRFMVSSWLAGKRVPSLDQMLTVFARLDLLIPFLEALVPLEQLPSIAAEARRRAADLSFFHERPEAFAVWLCLELDRYRALPGHLPGFIADEVGLSLEAEQEILARLEAMGAVEKRGGKYSVQKRYISTRPHFEVHKRLMTFWVGQGNRRMERLAESSDREVFSFLVYSCSRATSARIRRTLRQAFERARELAVADPAPAEGIEVVCLQAYDVSRGK